MTSSGAGADKTRQYREETEAMMLKQHDQDLDLLDSQVERMRMVSLEIGEEAEEHNRLLDTMVGSAPCTDLMIIHHVCEFVRHIMLYFLV